MNSLCTAPSKITDDFLAYLILTESKTALWRRSMSQPDVSLLRYAELKMLRLRMHQTLFAYDDVHAQAEREWLSPPADHFAKGR